MRSLYLIKPYFMRRRYLILIGILCLMAVDTLQLFIPRIVKYAVDDLSAMRIDALRLGRYAAEIICIAIVMALLRFCWRRLLIGTARIVEEGLRNRLFDHIQRLSAPYFDRKKTGDLMAHATNDINNVRMAVGMGVVALTDGIFLGSAAIGFMAYINVRLTALAMIPMPVIIIFTRIFGRKMHRLYTRVQSRFSDLTEVVRESFSGIRIVKAYNREPDEYRRLETISNQYITDNIKLVNITGSFFPLMVLFTNISLTIVIFFGGRFTITNTITPGDFVAFISYLGLLTWPMMAMGWVTNLIQRGVASLDRINAILETAPEISDRKDARRLPSISGRIDIEGLTFTYPTGTFPVLADLNLSIPAGTTLGIVGAQGCGKSTLLDLIIRRYDITDGRISIDGHDIRSIRLADLRFHIAHVPQEPYLFSGTIRENITFGMEVDKEELIRVTRAAALYDTIMQFPAGFDTLVGERGIILSGGQKQRIMLARALLRDEKILLLDDPIGQVDTETASVIIDTIRSMAGKKTIIIASHRIPAVAFADRIIVLDDAAIAESGSHQELVAGELYYARIDALQRLET